MVFYNVQEVWNIEVMNTENRISLHKKIAKANSLDKLSLYNNASSLVWQKHTRITKG